MKVKANWAGVEFKAESEDDKALLAKFVQSLREDGCEIGDGGPENELTWYCDDRLVFVIA